MRHVALEVMAMNNKVKARMFTFTVQLRRMLGASSLGDKEYDIITIPGYLMESLKVASYNLGKEVMSSAQVYIPGEEMAKVDEKDLVSVGTMQITESGVETFVPILSERQILRRDNFYRPGNAPDVGVIYLA